MVHSDWEDEGEGTARAIDSDDADQLGPGLALREDGCLANTLQEATTTCRSLAFEHQTKLVCSPFGSSTSTPSPQVLPYYLKSTPQVPIPSNRISITHPILISFLEYVRNSLHTV